jgi:simple sugar transport system ATP-binding protein
VSVSKNEEIVVEMKGITKRFPGVVANDGVNFDVKRGEVHALLGENGAGKTTLMNILSGMYKPDEGEIYFCQKRVDIKSPKDAIKLGIGMIHQHFMLVPSLSVVENVVLGTLPPWKPLRETIVERKLKELSKEYGIEVNLKAKIWQLSVGEQQRVEILKMLYRNVRVLIMDEPTSVLTPMEATKLMEALRRLAKEKSLSIVFITHKLKEAFAVSDRITVLRRGKVVATFETEKTSMEEVARKMFGDEYIFSLEEEGKKGNVEAKEILLDVKNVEALNDQNLPALKKVTFSLRKGEILGIAGVAGNGQKELAEVIVGLRKTVGGKVFLAGRDVTNRPRSELIKIGVGYIPEDRTKMGIVMDFSIAYNSILLTHHEPPFAYSWIFPIEKGLFINDNAAHENARKLMSAFGIMAPGTNTPARYLSGGNLQKLLVASVLSVNPKVLVAMNPTRGLDVATTLYVHNELLKLKSRGVAILLISEDLDEILKLSDRVAIMYQGEIMGIFTTEQAKSRFNEISLLMAGVKGQ